MNGMGTGPLPGKPAASGKAKRKAQAKGGDRQQDELDVCLYRYSLLLCRLSPRLALRKLGSYMDLRMPRGMCLGKTGEGRSCDAAEPHGAGARLLWERLTNNNNNVRYQKARRSVSGLGYTAQ